MIERQQCGRRGVLGLGLGTAALATPRGVAADGFPDRPVSLVVTGPAGGTTDFTARLIAAPLGARLGVPVVVENKAGGNGAVALQAVMRSRPDGHTLLIGYSGTLTGKPAVEGFADFDPRRDLAGIALILEAPQVMMVHPTVPADSLMAFIDYARALLQDEALQARALQSGGVVRFEDPATLDRRTADELQMWRRLVEEVGIRPD